MQTLQEKPERYASLNQKSITDIGIDQIDELSKEIGDLNLIENKNRKTSAEMAKESPQKTPMGLISPNSSLNRQKTA